MDIENLFYAIIIFICLLALSAAGITIGIVAYDEGYGAALKQKCAETQGRYDFCVAVTNWEVKE